MRIILLANVGAVGKKWEVHDVSDGYARNVLIPQGLAAIATGAYMQQAEQARQQLEQQAEEELRRAQEFASAIDGFEVVIRVRANANGDLYAAVTPRQIADVLLREGHEVPLRALGLPEPVKRIGEYPVAVTLDHGLEAQLKLIVEEAPESSSPEESRPDSS